MEPASDRSYHPSSDATLRSAFSGCASPAAQRSRSRGRGGFGEVKSPTSGGVVGSSSASAAPSPSSRDPSSRRPSFNGNGRTAASVAPMPSSSRADAAARNRRPLSGSASVAPGGGGGIGGRKSLGEHIASRNSRAPPPYGPYELDVESADRDQPAWASQDWCAPDSRVSRPPAVPEDAGTQAEDFSVMWNRAATAAASNNNHDGDGDFGAMGGNDYGGGSRRGGRDDGRSVNQGNYDDRSRGSGSRPTNQQNGGHNQYDAGGIRKRQSDRQDGGHNQQDDRSSRGGGRPLVQPQNDGPHNRDGRRPSGQGRPQAGWHDAAYDRKGSDGSERLGRVRRVDDASSRARSENRGSVHQGQPQPLPQPQQQPHQQSQSSRSHSRGPANDRQQETRSRSRGPTGSKSVHSPQNDRPHNRDGGRPSGQGRPQTGWHDAAYDRKGSDGSERLGRVRRVDDASSRARSKSRGSVHRGQPQKQPQPPPQPQQPPHQQSQSSRSHSRGPANDQQQEARSRSRSRGPSGSKSVQSSRSQRQQRSGSITRPTKRLGCLGGASDMTRRSVSRGGGRRHDASGETKANVESFEKDMRLQREQSMTDRMKGSSSLSKERRGRSQSRGPQSRVDGRSKSRGARTPHAGRRVPRDPSVSRSKSRPRNDPHAPSAQGGGPTPREKKSSHQSRRSLSRGRNSQSQCSTRASFDDGHPSNPHRKDTNNAAASGARSVPGSKSNSFKNSRKSPSSKATVLSSTSSRRSSTPETGPLSSYSGKSSRGSFLRSASKRMPSMPPSTPPQLDDASSHHSRPATPNRVPGGDESTINTSGHGSAGTGLGNDAEQILTNMFDRKGYCVRHQSVRLRKKKLLGGWNVLLANCPDCCVQEMGRLKRVKKKMKKKGQNKAEKVAEKEKKGDKPRPVPDLGSGEPRDQRSRSRGRTKKEQNATDARSARGGRGGGRRGKSQDRRPGGRQENAVPVFEFDISLDGKGDVASPSRADRSVKSRTSRKSSKSARTSKTNKSGKSTRTSRTSKSLRRKGNSRSKSRDTHKDGRGVGETVVSRSSQPGSSQRFIRQSESHLRVAKMPFTDKYKREGKYTGEINDYGQPHGQGTLRYNNGMVYEGLWEDGQSEDMDNNMARAKENGFSGNWMSNTKAAREKREKRSQQDMDDLRSFISQSVRSGMSNASGSQTGPQHDNGRNINRRIPPRRGQEVPGEVHEMPWSDVNGFSGHYSGEVNSQKIPDGSGFMQYSNGVVEEGMFCNGVFQPPSDLPHPSSAFDMGGNAGAIPSSSMSVWSLKSSPTMAFTQGGHNVLTGNNPGGGIGASSVLGAPTSVHLNGPDMYEDMDHRY